VTGDFVAFSSPYRAKIKEMNHEIHDDVKASKESEAGVMPSEAPPQAMGKYTKS